MVDSGGRVMTAVTYTMVVFLTQQLGPASYDMPMVSKSDHSYSHIIELVVSLVCGRMSDAAESRYIRCSLGWCLAVYDLQHHKFGVGAVRTHTRERSSRSLLLCFGCSQLALCLWSSTLTCCSVGRTGGRRK